MIVVRTPEYIAGLFGCSLADAQRYCDLRDEGHGSYQAALLAGIADPHDDADTNADVGTKGSDRWREVRDEETGE